MIVVGDGGVGKSSWVKQQFKGMFTEDYQPTMGVEIVKDRIFTNRGPIDLEIWDTGGQVTGLGEFYYVSANAAIIMFDVTSVHSYKNLPNHHASVLRMCGQIPVALVGNKIDVPSNERKVKAEALKAKSSKKDLHYFEISARSLVDCALPLLWICRKLTG